MSLTGTECELQSDKVNDDPLSFLQVCLKTDVFLKLIMLTEYIIIFYNIIMHVFFQKIVESTTSFKDRYFETHSIEDAINKNKDIDLLIQKNLEIFNKHEQLGLTTNKACYHYLKGKLLNVCATYSNEAEILLSKAIKLDPKLVDAWNELGECYCKNDDLVKAKSCFEGALKEVSF